MIPRNALRAAIAIGLLLLVVLLVAFFVVGALAWLLGAMGDESGQAVMVRLALALAALVVTDLILLVLALGLRLVDDTQGPPS